MLLTIVTGFVPATARGSEATVRPAPGVLAAAVKRTPAVKPAPVRTTRATTRAQANGGQSGSFFKSKPGILALAVMAAGAGYAVYSTQHDRIKSPGK